MKTRELRSPRWTPREKVSREVGGRVLVVIGMQRVERAPLDESNAVPQCAVEWDLQMEIDAD